MTQHFQSELPYDVEVIVTADGVLHEVKAKVMIEYIAERWDEYDGWDINYDIRFDELTMRNMETDEEITLIEDAETSVRKFIEDYIRNGAGGLNNSDVIQKCGEAIREEELYGYEEQH